MKKILAVYMCLLVSICSGQIPPEKDAIKIDYMVIGKNVSDKIYKKEACLDPSMVIVEYPMGPKFEHVKDSIVVVYNFKFFSEKKKCFVSATAILEILDKDMGITTKKHVYVTQFDTGVKFQIFFKDPKFNSENYFIQFKIATLDEEYVSTLARLPHRFEEQ